MTLNDYQAETERTSSSDVSVIVCALGLCGESGEFADHIKKWAAQGHELDKEKLTKELGDILWYTAQAARAIGKTLDKIAETNVLKLRARYPDGFDVERSKERK